MSEIITTLQEYRQSTSIAEQIQQSSTVTPDDVRAAIDDIREHTQSAQPYIYKTGPASAMADVERVISLDEIA